MVTDSRQLDSVNEDDLHRGTVRRRLTEAVVLTWEIPALTALAVINLCLNVASVVVVAGDNVETEAVGGLQMASTEALLECLVEALVVDTLEPPWE